MLRLTRARRGQTIIEYAVLIAVVVAALIAMRVYFKRALEGKVKDTADKVGGQFNPMDHTYNYTTATSSRATETTDSGMEIATDIEYQQSNATRNDTIRGFEEDHGGGLWGEAGAGNHGK